MQEMIAKNEIAGAVTVVVTKDKILHLESTGFADVAAKRPMTPDTLFWIASMTKPITGAAILMLQDEGKLNVADPVAKYLPEFANLKTPSGKPANLTITQILTHTSGLGEASGPAAQQAKTLADLGPALARRADAIRARRKVEIHAERHQRRRAHRRGGERHDLRRVSPEAALRSAGDEGHDLLPDAPSSAPGSSPPTRRTRRPARSNPCRRAPTSARATARRRATADSTRPRPTTRASARCSSTAARSKAAAT